MNHPFPQVGQGSDRIVYIRPVPVADLPEEARAQVSGDSVYAIHDADGKKNKKGRESKKDEKM